MTGTKDLTAPGVAGTAYCTTFTSQADITATPVSYSASITVPSGTYIDNGASTVASATATKPSEILAANFTETFDTSTGVIPPPTTTPVDSGLALTGVPGPTTTDATGPHGANVSYAPPTATDERGETPAVSCAPDTGATFSIGDTTVICTAADADDSNSPITATFTVTVRGAAEQLSDLHTAVQGVGPGSSLSDKVTTAQNNLAAGNTAGGCSALTAFANETQAQSGKTIPAATATRLITDVHRIQNVIGC